MEKEVRFYNNNNEIVAKEIENLDNVNSDKTQEKTNILDNRIFSLLKTVTTIKSKELKSFIIKNTDLTVLQKYLKFVNVNNKPSNTEINLSYFKLNTKNILCANFQLINNNGDVLSDPIFVNFSNNFPDNIINTKNENSKGEMDSKTFLKLMDMCFLKILNIEVLALNSFNHYCYLLNNLLQIVIGSFLF